MPLSRPSRRSRCKRPPSGTLARPRVCSVVEVTARPWLPKPRKFRVLGLRHPDEVRALRCLPVLIPGWALNILMEHPPVQVLLSPAACAAATASPPRHAARKIRLTLPMTLPRGLRLPPHTARSLLSPSSANRLVLPAPGAWSCSCPAVRLKCTGAAVAVRAIALGVTAGPRLTMGMVEAPRLADLAAVPLQWRNLVASSAATGVRSCTSVSIHFPVSSVQTIY